MRRRHPLYQQMLALGITLQSIADAAGVSKTTVYNQLTGRYKLKDKIKCEVERAIEEELGEEEGEDLEESEMVCEGPIKWDIVNDDRAFLAMEMLSDEPFRVEPENVRGSAHSPERKAILVHQHIERQERLAKLQHLETEELLRRYGHLLEATETVIHLMEQRGFQSPQEMFARLRRETEALATGNISNDQVRDLMKWSRNHYED